MPFKASNIQDLHKLILKGNFDFSLPSISESSQDLIRRMLVLTPEDRISIPDILSHPWVADDAEEGIDEEVSDHDLKVGATFFR